jgi:hypothetical protein
MRTQIFHVFFCLIITPKIAKKTASMATNHAILLIRPGRRAWLCAGVILVLLQCAQHEVKLEHQLRGASIQTQRIGKSHANALIVNVTY